MAQGHGEKMDAWENSKSGSSVHGAFLDINHNSFSLTWESDVKHDESPRLFTNETPVLLDDYEAIEVFHHAVDVARDLVHKQGENEKISAAVQPNLTLDLKRRGLQSLPEEVIRIIYRDVERIVLSHNYISCLPSSFFDCTTMQYLNLRANRFTEFPKPLLHMEKLQILDLSRNSLEFLPEDMNRMKALRVLSVMHNRLLDLPLSLGTLESLRILKMIGNPLNEQLRAIIDNGEQAASPTTPVAENEKDALLTLRIKNHLRNEINTFESGGESNESPLETPRPLKRNPSLRFPVIPAVGPADADSRSPSLFKPPIPNRSHHRIASANNPALYNTTFRRPSVSPLILGNERHRSNSENVVPMSQIPRNKRMGIVPRKAGLSPLEESTTNRNSLHLRGTSHGSVLKDRGGKGSVTSRTTHADDSADETRQSGTFIRQLSSIPEQKSSNTYSNQTIEGARSLLFALHSLHPYISSLLPLAGDEGSRRSSLERVFYNSSTHLDSLDHELYLCSNLGQGDHERQQKRLLRTIRRSCRACIVAYLQVGKLLLKNAHNILRRGDQRYVRILLLLLYGSNMEAANALSCLGKGTFQTGKPLQPRETASSLHENVPKLTVHAMTPTLEVPPATMHIRNDTSMGGQHFTGSQILLQNYDKYTTQPQSAVPSYINGRSRSNSRSHNFNFSAASSVASTPGSGESFLTSQASFLPEGNDRHRVEPNDVVFEKVYRSLQRFVTQAQTSLPTVCSLFGRCLDSARSKSDERKYLDLWSRLHSRARQTFELCETLDASLGSLKLNDLEVRSSLDFWSQVTRFTNGFVSLCEDVKVATAMNREQMARLEISRLLKPVHRCVRVSIQTIRDSPWAFILANNVPHMQNQVSNPWQVHGHLNNSVGPRLQGHHRGRGSSGSSSSPFMPTTPLSAALGPAAQATIPSVTSGSNSFDRSFQGDVFQRAEFALTMQHSAQLRRV